MTVVVEYIVLACLTAHINLANVRNLKEVRKTKQLPTYLRSFVDSVSCLFVNSS